MFRLLPEIAIGLYRLIGRIASPLVRLHMARRRTRGREDGARLGERYGEASAARPAGPLIWIHASSVGEALSTLSLIDAVRQRWPNLAILITTGTVSSARLMAERLPEGIIHQFVPLDLPGSVARFFAHWRPSLGMIVESELWPNLLVEAEKQAVPLVLVNARMSERSYRWWRRLRPFAHRLLEGFRLVLAQSPENEARFVELGVAHHSCPGNLKFAAAPLKADRDLLARTERALRERPRWLASSTHPGEERLVGEAHRLLRQRFPDLLTIIVPRHPDRGAAIAEELAAQGHSLARRSAGEGPDQAEDIYLADTIGEMGLWYRVAGIVFIGKTLVAKGGQNPLEPAKLNCALISGPHQGNFRQIATELEAAGALLRAEDAAGLAKAVRRLLEDPGLRARVAQAGITYANSQMQVLERIVDAIEPLVQPAVTGRASGPGPTPGATDKAASSAAKAVS